MTDITVTEATDTNVVPLQDVLDERTEALEQRLLSQGVSQGLIALMQTDARIETLIESVFPDGTDRREQFEMAASARLYQRYGQVWKDITTPQLALPPSTLA